MLKGRLLRSKAHACPIQLFWTFQYFSLLALPTTLLTSSVPVANGFTLFSVNYTHRYSLTTLLQPFLVQLIPGSFPRGSPFSIRLHCWYKSFYFSCLLSTRIQWTLLYEQRFSVLFVAIIPISEVGMLAKQANPPPTVPACLVDTSSHPTAPFLIQISVYGWEKQQRKQLF